MRQIGGSKRGRETRSDSSDGDVSTKRREGREERTHHIERKEKLEPSSGILRSLVSRSDLSPLPAIGSDVQSESVAIWEEKEEGKEGQ